MTHNSANQSKTVYSQIYEVIWNKIALERGARLRQEVLAKFQSLIDLRTSFKSYNPFKSD